MAQNSDGSFVVAGYTYSYGTSGQDIYITKFDANGTFLWGRSYSGLDISTNSVIHTSDGGYALAGGYNHYYLLKLDASGVFQWDKQITIPTSGNAEAYSVVQNLNGSYTTVGWYGDSLTPGMYIVKFDSLGNTCGNTTAPSVLMGTGGSYSVSSPAIITPSAVVTSPTPTINSGGSITNQCLVGIEPISNYIPKSIELYQNYPNPFNPVTNIKYQIAINSFVTLEVYDILGKLIATLLEERQNPGSYEIRFDGSNHPSGVYFYRIKADENIQTKRMVLIK